MARKRLTQLRSLPPKSKGLELKTSSTRRVTTGESISGMAIPWVPGPRGSWLLKHGHFGGYLVGVIEPDASVVAWQEAGNVLLIEVVAPFRPSG